MIKHFLKTGIRNFWRNKSSTILNILGLSIGMATTLMILEYVFNELSFDRFHENREGIYRLIIKMEKEGEIRPSAYITAAVAPSMAEEFPGIRSFVRFSNPEGGFFSFGSEKFQVDNLSFADSALFDMFSFQLVKGTAKTALAQPYQVVLTQTTAGRIFGDENPLGKVIRLNGKENLTVTGILSDLPKNSHLQFDALISFSTLYLNPDYYLDWNGGNNYLSYIRLAEGTDIEQLRDKFPAFMEKNINYKYRQYGFVLHLDMQALQRIHLFSKKDFGIDEEGDLQGLYIFSSIALFILLIACINFINLTSARSFSRTREIGLRKVAGATRRNIIFQFLFETFLISILAFILSVLLVDLFQPRFNELIGRDLGLFGPVSWTMLAGMMLLIMLTSFAAGSYPAWYMSRFPAILSIKGTMVSGKGKSALRNVLVVFQFVISIVLIILTLVIYTQMTFINARPLGYSGKDVIVIPVLGEKAMHDFQAVKTALKQIPQVVECGASSDIPGYGFTMNGYHPEGYKEPIMIHVLDADEDYLHVMKVPVIQGRGFDPGLKSDSSSYLINETLAKELNWDDPVGKTISRGGKHNIIGVVGDFHFASLHQTIQPLIITRQPWLGYSFLSVRIQSGSWEQVMPEIESAWASIISDEPFDYFILEDYVNDSYSGINHTREAILWFSMLAIFIAGLGLLGLANFTFNQRKKEIGIRKVLGAESGRIARQVTFEFLRLVFISGFLALPLTWYAMDKWMEAFAYKAHIGPGVFIFPVVIVTILAWLTIYYQVRKLADTNPVDVLKFE